ncbi:unnamed protein product [Ilex paraguariensis]|uniref:Uncharacterized protein n=1 Tax=Ilex paraguariensis TaxID=185542 RepID=A0ABC8U9X7_9AQUA
MKLSAPPGGGQQSPAASKTEAVDTPLHVFGFEIEELSPQKVTGRLQVTDKSVQGVARRRVGTDSGGTSKHRSSHGIRVAEGGRYTTHYQPSQGCPSRRPYLR